MAEPLPVIPTEQSIANIEGKLRERYAVVLEILWHDKDEGKRPTGALPRHMLPGRIHFSNNPAEKLLVALDEESALPVRQSTLRKTRVDGVMGDDCPCDQLTAGIEAINDRAMMVVKIARSGLDRERSQHVLAFTKECAVPSIRDECRYFSSCQISDSRVVPNLTHDLALAATYQI